MSNPQTQAGDVILYQSLDNGEMVIIDGLTYMTQGPETMAYLALFGSNEEDDGSESTAHLQWWGNEGEAPQYQYRGKFNALIAASEGLSSGKALELQQAAQDDLDAAFAGIADSVEVAIAIVQPKRIRVTAQINLPDGTTVPFEMEAEIDT